MPSPRASFLALVLAASGCSSGSFDVAATPADDATVDASADSTTTPDSSAVDTAVASDGAPTDGLVADAPKTDGAHADVVTTPDVVVTPGCATGTMQPCECGGTRTCLDGGTWGARGNKCPVAPARFRCAYGESGCTNPDCIDTNNCGAKCDCQHNPGITCSFSDPCWAFACREFVCP